MQDGVEGVQDRVEGPGGEGVQDRVEGPGGEGVQHRVEGVQDGSEGEQDGVKGVQETSVSLGAARLQGCCVVGRSMPAHAVLRSTASKRCRSMDLKLHSTVEVWLSSFTTL